MAYNLLVNFCYCLARFPNPRGSGSFLFRFPRCLEVFDPLVDFAGVPSNGTILAGVRGELKLPWEKTAFLKPADVFARIRHDLPQLRPTVYAQHVCTFGFI